MGHAEIDQTMAVAGDQQPNAAMMQVIIDTHGRPGDRTPQTGTLASTNIEHRGTDEVSINQFPNGVKFGVGPGTMTIEAPPGGRVVDKGGVEYGKSLGVQGGPLTAHGEGTVVYDSHNKAVAMIDKDNVMHVRTKNGEYTETPDGKVTFKPASAADLTTLHHGGVVSQSKYEDYGISTNGNRTRFPNGIEHDARTGGITIPSEYPNFNEQKKYDDKDHLIARVGTDGNGKVLYTLDTTGFHVPTQDGTLSQNGNGTVRFDGTKPTSHSLPSLTISDAQK